MATVMKRLTKGVVLRGETSDSSENLEGSIWNNSTTTRFKVYIEAAVRELVTTNQSQILTNKTIDADLNTITNIDNADIKAGAAIDLTKLANGALPSGITVNSSNITDLSIVNADISATAAIDLSKLATGALPSGITVNSSNIADLSIVNADVSASAAIERSKIATGTADHVVINSATGALSSESALAASRGGLGTSGAAFTGVVKAASGVFSAATLVNADVSTTAAIARTKLASGTANRVVVNDGTGVMSDAAAITASRALASDTNGIPVASATTAAELGFVSGVTSSIQTQLGTKVNASGGTLTNGSIVTPVRSDVKQDTLSNLVTYASTASNGQIVYATDEKSMYQVVDSALVGIGGAGIVKLTAGENIAALDLVYVSTGTGNDSGRTAGRLYKVDASNDDRNEVLGFAPKAITSGAIGEAQVSGNLKGFTGLTPGKIYYASASVPGAITLIPPSTNGQWVIAVCLASIATEVVINPVSSASAIYVVDSDSVFTVANNQSSAANITGLLIDGASTRSFIIDYSIYRKTDTASSALAQVGQLRGVFNTQSSTWFMSDDSSGQNSGVTFSILSSGQIRYISSNISGANYTGSLKYAIRKTFGV